MVICYIHNINRVPLCQHSTATLFTAIAVMLTSSVFSDDNAIMKLSGRGLRGCTRPAFWFVNIAQNVSNKLSSYVRHRTSETRLSTIKYASQVRVSLVLFVVVRYNYSILTFDKIISKTPALARVFFNWIVGSRPPAKGQLKEPGSKDHSQEHKWYVR